ncbi:Sensor histidine kinase RcsC [Pseudomonas sp. MM221]|nr:Sensor histidine kinase RcsC [Pseudomonas sp. MM221]
MRILLVEDNRDILANLADYLGMKGYTVDCAQDGLSGLHLAATEHYDLIVLDIMLPGIDGYTLCKRLREDARRDTPVIMLTARDQLDDRLQGFRSGADDYLLKPFALSGWRHASKRCCVVLRVAGAARCRCPTSATTSTPWKLPVRDACSSSTPSVSSCWQC